VNRILLQTTIPPAADDWSIARFSLLHEHLAAARGADGAPLFEVVARDRAPVGRPDPVLSTLDESSFDEVWLFAVDTGDGLTDEDCAGLARFRRRGGGLMLTRDHMDLGSSLCFLDDVAGSAHHFHTRNPDPDVSRRCVDDTQTPAILWPNYHSGANGDFQAVRVLGAPHPVLRDADAPTGLVRYLPSHPHEGAVSAPADDPGARVILEGQSRTTGRAFALAVAFEPGGGLGPALAESTFHHFCDYNWDISRGAPSFVAEAPGDGMARNPEALRSTRRYALNVALWLAGRLPA
jgi:hypothetical protein